MNIVIEIDELVLHGFPPGERYRIGEAVQAELARILGERGLPGAWTGSAADPAGWRHVSTSTYGDARAAIGAGVAEAVYRTMTDIPGKPGGIG